MFWVQYSTVYCTVQFSFSSSSFPRKNGKEKRRGKERKKEEEERRKKEAASKKGRLCFTFCILMEQNTKYDNVTSQLFTSDFYCDF
jgi:hypothetical protein